MKLRLFFVLMGFSILLSCKKDKAEPAPEVYVAGLERNASGINVPKIWKNGKIEHILTDGASHAHTRSLFITPNGEVYVAGRVSATLSSGLLAYYAQLWKDGQPSVFLSRLGECIANDVFVNDDIYVAGTMQERATVWKNGDYLYLTNGAYRAGLYCIYVDNGDVYAGGFEDNAAGKNIAKIWKNGVPIILSSNSGLISDIYVAGGDVYAVGYEVNSAGKTVAKMWKNGTATSLTDGVANANAYGINVVGTDVYIAGNDGKFAKIWKNGVGTNLTVVGVNESSIVARSVAVHGNDVYVAGSYYGPVHSGSYDDHAVLWKNGVETPLEINDNLRASNAITVIVK